jgi:hypothetical protein
MKQRPLWELKRSSAIKDISCILWNQKVHYDTQKCPPLVSIFSKIYPVHALPSCIFKINFDIILPPTPRSFRSSPPFTLSNHTMYIFLFFPHMCLMGCYTEFNSSQLWKFWDDLSPKTSVTNHQSTLHNIPEQQRCLLLPVLGTNVSLNTQFLNSLSLWSSINVRDQLSQAHTY